MPPEAWQWFQQFGLAQGTMTIPFVEGLLLLILLTLCLLFRLSRTGLIVAYLFVYAWGWRFQEQNLPANSSFHDAFLTAYIVCGILVFAFGIVGVMFYNSREH